MRYIRVLINSPRNTLEPAFGAERIHGELLRLGCPPPSSHRSLGWRIVRAPEGVFFSGGTKTSGRWIFSPCTQPLEWTHNTLSWELGKRTPPSDIIHDREPAFESPRSGLCSIRLQSGTSERHAARRSQRLCRTNERNAKTRVHGSLSLLLTSGNFNSSFMNISNIKIGHAATNRSTRAHHYCATGPFTIPAYERHSFGPRSSSEDFTMNIPGWPE